MKEKSLFFILGLFIIIVVIGAVLLGSFQKKYDSVGINPPLKNLTTIEYKNTQYGFGFTLPKSWEGYTVIVDNWEGYSLTETSAQGQVITERGPLLYIRHPAWTDAVPRQDIPIMVFTLTQWNKLINDEFHIGAAPMGPSELGRNSKYIFAIPARYNYAYPVGFEEVDGIIKNKTAFNVF